MKFTVFSDLHGSVSAAAKMLSAAAAEKSDRVFLLGDVYGFDLSDKLYIAELLKRLPCRLTVLKGNNDWSGDQEISPFVYDDTVPVYAFGRMIYFNHGHVYNELRQPYGIRSGDALVYGHTHTGKLSVSGGVFLVNVGSFAYPRGGAQKNYLTIDEKGFVLKNSDCEVLSELPF